MADKKEKITGTTPKGVFSYPWISAPSTKFNPNGDFKVDLILNKEDADVLLEKLQPHYDANLKEAKKEFDKLKPETRKRLGAVKENPLYREEYDSSENLTGNLIFSFKAAAQGERKDGSTWTFKPAVFDSKGAAISPVPQIYGGSEGKVAFEAVPYFIPSTGLAGLKLRLKAVKIIKLSGGSQSASAFGFDDDDDGYTFKKEETNSFDDSDDTVKETATDDEEF